MCDMRRTIILVQWFVQTLAFEEQISKGDLNKHSIIYNDSVDICKTATAEFFYTFKTFLQFYYCQEDVVVEFMSKRTEPGEEGSIRSTFN